MIAASEAVCLNAFRILAGRDRGDERQNHNDDPGHRCRLSVHENVGNLGKKNGTEPRPVGPPRGPRLTSTRPPPGRNTRYTSWRACSCRAPQQRQNQAKHNPRKYDAARPCLLSHQYRGLPVGPRSSRSTLAGGFWRKTLASLPMARNSRYFDVQGVDEGLQVTILDAVPLNPAKPAANHPQKAAGPWRPQLQERLAVFATSRGKASGLATSRGEARGINAADLVDIRPPGTVLGHGVAWFSKPPRCPPCNEPGSWARGCECWRGWAKPKFEGERVATLHCSPLHPPTPRHVARRRNR